MSDIRQVSEYEFRTYRVSFTGPFGALIIEEREWYVGSLPDVLGVVIFDRIDGDWGFVVLSADETGNYIATATGASLLDIDAAREALISAMQNQTAQS